MRLLRGVLVCWVTLLLPMASTVQAAAPVNDECAGALLLNAGSNAGDSTGATGAVDSVGNCSQPIVNDVWYAFVCSPGSLGRVTVTPNLFFASAALYDTCGGNALSCAQPGGVPSPAVVQVFNDSVAAKTYLLQVGAYFTDDIWPDHGTFGIEVQMVPPPANDTCENAALLADGVTQGDLSSATGSPVETCQSDVVQSFPDVWYRVQVPPHKSASIFADVGEIYPALSLYPTCGSSQLICNGVSTYRTFLPNPGDTALEALLRVADAGGKRGTFALELTFSDVPANNLCDHAKVVTAGTFAESNFNVATSDDMSSCDLSAYADLWYSITIPAKKSAEVSAVSGDFGAIVAAFAACKGTKLACDSQGYPDDVAAISIPNATTQEKVVIVGVAAYGAPDGGAFTLNVAFADVTGEGEGEGEGEG